MSERSLPEKPATDSPTQPAKGKGVSKGKFAPRPQQVRGAMRLKTKTEAKETSQASTPETYADQTASKRKALDGEGYVRLRVRVDEDGGASVIGSHFVDSTLVEPSAIHGNFVYEVTEGDKLLHVDSIPDLGVFRSFVNPDGPPEERKHHIYELKTYEFDARVPAQELAAASLPKVVIALYRVKETKPDMPVCAKPLRIQYERELREVARVDGVPARILPDEMQRERGVPKPSVKRSSKSGQRS